MTRSAELDRSRLSVLLDVRHPLAYLALGPTVELGTSEGIVINWLPLPTPSLNAPSIPAAGDDRGTRHRRFRAGAITREIEVYAAAQGLVLREHYRNADAGAANLGWLWMRERHPDGLERYLEELFRAYWAVELDAASQQDVVALLEKLGAEGTSFGEWCADEGPTRAAEIDSALREHGLFGVPAYLVEGEVFYGRQHLPMIRWILRGRDGPGPI